MRTEGEQVGEWPDEQVLQVQTPGPQIVERGQLAEVAVPGTIAREKDNADGWVPAVGGARAMPGSLLNTAHPYSMIRRIPDRLTPKLS